MSATTRDTRPRAPGTPSQIGSPSLLSHCSSPRPELGTEHSPAALYPSPAGPPELGSSMSSRRPPWPSLSLAVRAPNPPFFSAEHPSSLLVEGPHLPGSLLVSPWDSLGPSRPSIGSRRPLPQTRGGWAWLRPSLVPCPLPPVGRLTWPHELPRPAPSPPPSGSPPSAPSSVLPRNDPPLGVLPGGGILWAVT